MLLMGLASGSQGIGCCLSGERFVRLFSGRPFVSVVIQLFAFGSAFLGLQENLVHSGLRCSALPDLAQANPGHPLLLAYSDPLDVIRANGDILSPSVVGGLLDLLPGLQASGIRCRLVNLTCVSVPGVVAWCVAPSPQVSDQATARFTVPDPFDALLALKWLNEHPEHLETYQALESHPLAAALDGRPPDLDCLARYRQAASLDALLAARQERAALEVELSELAEQLQPLREHQLEALVLREQLEFLQARLREADVLQERCSELQLSLQAQQLDLEQLARRLALLEELVGAGSHASLRLQERIAQALSG